MNLSGADILWSCLCEHDVDTVFGYPGGAILPAYDRLLDHPIRHVLVRHEQSATHMADGYARASGRVGVAVATSGPGATNLVTGIATAMMDSIPLVCITGRVPAMLLGSDAFQETDITGITLPITKHNYLVQRAEDIAPIVREAFRVATTGRPGPVLVDITKNALQDHTEFTPMDPATVEAHVGTVLEAGLLREAADLIAKAERPVILAGHGILKSHAMAELRELAERAHVPVAVTRLGIGCLPADHPLNLGMMGMDGEAGVNAAIHDADLLIALGMRFDDRVTGRLARYAPDAKKIHVDINRTEINKLVRADVGIVGDLRAVLQALLPHVGEGSREAWITRIGTFAGGPTVRDLANIDEPGPLQAAHVIHDIWRATAGRAVIVTDVGQHQMRAAQYHRVSEPHTWITSGGLGTMGFALPAAVGAKLARPECEVWAIVGDGGFQMTQAELATLVQEGVKINIAIIDNGFLGMVRQWQQFFHDRRYSATPLSSPDFVKIADAHGLPGIHVSTREESAAAIRHARASAGPVLIDFHVQQEDAVYPMVAPGAALHEMIRAPSSVAESGAELL
jgi:acetolactate synthase I/II/III large subunit